MAGKERTRCKRGHPLTPDNVVYVSGNGMPTCKVCRRASVERRREKAKAQRAANPPAPVTHCKRGHEFTEENTRIGRSHGERECRACGRLLARRRYWADPQRARAYERERYRRRRAGDGGGDERVARGG